MWLEEADGFAEIFKGYLPFYLFVAVPIFILMSPAIPVAAASNEFTVYRMQQYDLHTVPHGCRSASINLEGRSLRSWSTSRHCVVARIQDLTIEQFMEIRSKAGALLLVLPKNSTILTAEEKEHIQLLEMAMSQQEINIPVYFVPWSSEMEDILSDLQFSFITDDKAGTALEAVINTVSSNGYQIVVTAPTPHKLDSKPVTLHARLPGRAGADTIVIAAHYDSSAIVPELSPGADSNASGAAALLELARVFSRLYAGAATRGAPTLLFLLTPTGRALNYFSAKRWLEEQLDAADSAVLQDVSFVLCLDSLSGEGAPTLHVSKPPRAGGAIDSLRARLRSPLRHKKINLADELLAWQHERFSIRRMAACTLSAQPSPGAAARGSVLDRPAGAAAARLAGAVRAVARALASHIYNLTDADGDSDGRLYDDALDVDEASVRHWYWYLSSQPRAPHVVTTGGPNSGVSAALERALRRWAGGAGGAAGAGGAGSTTHAPDARDPDYALYGPTRATLYVYSVKPAVFDLVLTLAIAAYLAVLYFAMQLFPRFYAEFAKLVTRKTKVQ